MGLTAARFPWGESQGFPVPQREALGLHVPGDGAGSLGWVLAPRLWGQLLPSSLAWEGHKTGSDLAGTCSGGGEGTGLTQKAS